MLAVHAPEGSSILFFLANRFSFEARAMVPWGCAFAVSHPHLSQKTGLDSSDISGLHSEHKMKKKSAEPAAWIGDAGKNLENFLHPPMPGAFSPSRVRKMHVELLRDRYIQVFSASMGNHSLSKFYCCWSQEQFEAAMNPAFEKALERARTELADRAALIMHRGMGLVAADGDAMVPPTVTAAMAKVVESMTNPDGTKGIPRKAYKLTVNGLARPTPSAVVPSGPRRGPGRPPKQAPAGPEVA